MVLVGAGPGDPDLLTRLGARWLAQADVVIYDRLIDPALLDLCPPHARHIYVGKRPDGPSTPQETINRLLIDHARAGRHVVRLKGGDPYLFGRGGEEAQLLSEQGISFRVVPGITAALAAGACAGIPLTHRELASSVTLVTGHEDPAKAETSLDWAALARMDTLVIYMGVGRLGAIVDRLLAEGRDGDEPAAVVQDASQPTQRTLRAPLGDLPAELERAGIRPPALVIVGKVASLAGVLNWRERLPLHGRTVLNTRPAGQAAGLTRRLADAGARVLQAPAIEITPVPDSQDVSEALAQLDETDWIVLTSVNGVEALDLACRRRGLDARHLAGCRIAAVGPATADALADRFLTADLVADRFTTDALADALIASGDLAGRRVTLLRADIATPQLPEALRAAGADVREVTGYRTTPADNLPAPTRDALDAREVDWITFTSASTVHALADLADRLGLDLSPCRRAAIGPVTAEALAARGLAPTVTADPHTTDALAEAILRHEKADHTE